MDNPAANPLSEEEYESLVTNIHVAEAFRSWSDDKTYDSRLRCVRAIVDGLVEMEMKELPRAACPVPAPAGHASDDVTMSLIEWNGRLAETIVAQADQIVALNVELRQARAHFSKRADEPR